MKKYLIQKTIEAEPMLKAAAEARLGREIDSERKDNMGYLTCDMETLQWTWVPESKFEGKPCDTPLEKLEALQGQMASWKNFFATYNKNKPNMTLQERNWIYQANRHVDFFMETISKIININQIQQQ